MCKNCNQIYVTTNKPSKDLYFHDTNHNNDNKIIRNSNLFENNPILFNFLTYQNYHKCNEFHFEPICCAECNVSNKLVYDVLSNDIKCYQCKDLDFKNHNGIICDTLYDICVYCKSEFEGKLKIYNVLEKRDIEYAARISTMKNEYAYSSADLKEKNEKLNFAYVHNENLCKGKILKGEYNNKKIVICGECKKFWYYDKYKFNFKNTEEIEIKKKEEILQKCR